MLDRPTATPSQAADVVVAGVRRRITAGLLPPGSPLRDAALAAEFDVSRNTVREALRMLRHDGLVRHQLHRGVVVRSLTPADVRDIYVVRRTLELRAVEESGTADDVALATLRAAVEDAEAAVRRCAWKQVGTASLAFHQALVASLDSPSLDAFFSTVVARLRLAFAVMADEGGFQAPWVPRDRHLHDLVVTGRRDRAGEALRLYLEDSERVVLDVVRGQAATAVSRAKERDR